MLQGGISPDDLVTIIGEQSITIRVLQQEKRERDERISQLLELLEKCNDESENESEFHESLIRAETT